MCFKKVIWQAFGTMYYEYPVFLKIRVGGRGEDSILLAYECLSFDLLRFICTGMNAYSFIYVAIWIDVYMYIYDICICILCMYIYIYIYIYTSKYTSHSPAKYTV